MLASTTSGCTLYFISLALRSFPKNCHHLEHLALLAASFLSRFCFYSFLGVAAACFPTQIWGVYYTNHIKVRIVVTSIFSRAHGNLTGAPNHCLDFPKWLFSLSRLTTIHRHSKPYSHASFPNPTEARTFRSTWQKQFEYHNNHCHLPQMGLSKPSIRQSLQWMPRWNITQNTDWLQPF